MVTKITHNLYNKSYIMSECGHLYSHFLIHTLADGVPSLSFVSLSVATKDPSVAASTVDGGGTLLKLLVS